MFVFVFKRKKNTALVSDAFPTIAPFALPTKSVMPRATHARVENLEYDAYAMCEEERKVTMDRVMSVDNYNANKRLIAATLRNKGDPPPRIMAHGSGCIRSLFLTVEALLKKRPGARLVRGYKLHTVPLIGRDMGGDAIKATFHVVLAQPSTSDPSREVYECACAAYFECDKGLPFVFVPSSRAHPQVPDEELLGNQWIPGCVIFGNLVWADTTCAIQRVVGRRAGVIGTTPEACVAKRNWRVRLFPFFEDWYNDRKPQRYPSDDMQTYAEFFGFPIYEVRDNERWKSLEYGVMQQGVEDNDVAIVSGDDTLKFCALISVKLHAKKITDAQARACFEAHYDECLTKVMAAHEDQLAEAVGANHL